MIPGESAVGKGLRGYRASGSAPGVPWASAHSEPGTLHSPVFATGRCFRSLQVCSGHGPGKSSWCGKELGPGPQCPLLRALPRGRRGSWVTSGAEPGSLALRIACIRWLGHICRDFYFVTVHEVRLAGKISTAPLELSSVEGGDASDAPAEEPKSSLMRGARSSFGFCQNTHSCSWSFLFRHETS